MKRTDSILDRGLPMSSDAERFVLGSLLLQDCFQQVSEILGSGDFAIQSHRHIWHAMENLHSAGKPIDRASICLELQAAGKLEAAGGFSYVANLDEGLPAVCHIEHYADTVAKLALRRRAILACQQTIDSLIAGDNTPDTLTNAHRTLERLTEQSQGTGGDIQSVGAAIQEIGIETLMAPATKASGAVQLPWETLRGVVPYLTPGQLILWAARPGNGKTVAACQIAIHAAREGHPVGFISLEMKKPALIIRMACQIAEVDSHWIKTGLIRSPVYLDERKRLNRAMTELAELPLFIEDQYVTTVPSVAAKLRRLKASRGLGLTIVDYLQLLDAVGRVENANARIGQISRGLKLLGSEMNCPVIALSQLTRANEKENRAPQISDLRDSGCLDADGDVVIFNHVLKDEKILKTVDMDIIVAKQREGAVLRRRFQFQKQFTVIVDHGAEYGR